MDALAEHALDLQGDGELLRRFVAGDGEEAFAALVRRHGGMVFSVCRAVLAESHDAEDAAQAVFLTLAQKAGTLDRHATIAGWLHRVAWHTAMRLRAAREIRRRHEKEYSGMQNTTSPLPDESIPPEVLHAALADLPEKYRIPLLLHYLEGRSEAETAAMLGIGVSAASMRLSRGREKLRHRLSRGGLAMPTAEMALALGGLGRVGMPGKFAASAAHSAVAILTGHATTAAASASALALSKGALSMLVRSKLKTAAIIAVSALMVAGAAATTYVLASGGPGRSTPVSFAETQKDSDAVIKSAREKMSVIRKKIEDAGHAHNADGHTKVVDAGFEFMAANLHNPDVAKFDPLAGFADYTVSTGDNGAMMLLLERTDAHNGLNLTIDPKHGTVVNTAYWGK